MLVLTILTANGRSQEDNFACYEPYCANLTNAQDLAIAENAALSVSFSPSTLLSRVLTSWTRLQKLSHVLDPVSELAPLLIKPVQRICKYPLLISVRDLRFLLKATRALTRGFPPSQQLLKNTPDTFPYYNELKAGLESVMRVTDKVNEEKRRQDNTQAVTDLAHRVEDWKGHDLSSFGQLLLHENFVVIKSDNEREYSVYLFERIILCCKEVVAQGKKDKKSNSILKRPSSQRINKLQLKGRIFVNNVTAASPLQSRNGSFSFLLSPFPDLALTRFRVYRISQASTSSKCGGAATSARRRSRSSAGRRSCCGSGKRRSRAPSRKRRCAGGTTCRPVVAPIAAASLPRLHSSRRLRCPKRVLNCRPRILIPNTRVTLPRITLRARTATRTPLSQGTHPATTLQDNTDSTTTARTISRRGARASQDVRLLVAVAVAAARLRGEVLRRGPSPLVTLATTTVVLLTPERCALALIPKTPARTS